MKGGPRPRSISGMTKIVTLEEVKKHNNKNSVWFVIHNKVYDVTPFLEEHPGGEEILLEQAGKNATEIFDDVSHSLDAKNSMQNYLVGELPENEKIIEPEKKKVPIGSGKGFDDNAHSLTWAQWVLTIAISLGVGLLVRNWLSL